jgi:hypothetical protein
MITARPVDGAVPRSPVLQGPGKRTERLFCPVAKNSQLTIEAVQNGGSVRRGVVIIDHAA